jgi:hypothetical protein
MYHTLMGIWGSHSLELRAKHFEFSLNLWSLSLHLYEIDVFKDVLLLNCILQESHRFSISSIALALFNYGIRQK